MSILYMYNLHACIALPCIALDYMPLHYSKLSDFDLYELYQLALDSTPLHHIALHYIKFHHTIYITYIDIYTWYTNWAWGSPRHHVSECSHELPKAAKNEAIYDNISKKHQHTSTPFGPGAWFLTGDTMSSSSPRRNGRPQRILACIKILQNCRLVHKLKWLDLKVPKCSLFFQIHQLSPSITVEDPMVISGIKKLTTLEMTRCVFPAFTAAPARRFSC